MVVATGLLALDIIVSGGLVSALESPPAWAGVLHKVAPWGLASMTATLLYLLSVGV